MTNDDMMKDFLGWEDSPSRLPKAETVPVSEMAITPLPRADEKPAPTYINPDRKEPTIQTPDVPYVEIKAPLPISPVLPEHRAIAALLSTEKYRDLFNATIPQVKDLSLEDTQKLIHSMDEKIEMIKVQKWAVRVTYEGKVQLADEKTRKKLKEADSAFYVPRREKGSATAKSKGNGEAKSAKKALSDMEKGIQQLVKLHMDEASIRKTLIDAGSPVPENLTAIISQFQLKH